MLLKDIFLHVLRTFTHINFLKAGCFHLSLVVKTIQLSRETMLQSLRISSFKFINLKFI